MNQCSRCESDQQIEIHHIIHRADGGKDTPDNLTPLCQGCHDYQHALENIEEHITKNQEQKQWARLKIWEYRLKVLNEMNTPELIKERGYTPYWTDVKTHYMSREVKEFIPRRDGQGILL